MNIEITTNPQTMYFVAKLSSEDERPVQHFVYNNGDRSDGKYGQFAVVYSDGVYVQDEDFCLEKVTPAEAASTLVSEEDKFVATSIIQSLLDNAMQE